MTHVLRSGPDEGIPVVIIGRDGQRVSIRNSRGGIHVVDETEVEEEPIDRELPRMLFARRVANFVRHTEHAEQNKSVITAALLYFEPWMYTRTLPDWAKSDTTLVAAAILRGWSGTYVGKDKAIALLLIKKHRSIHRDNVPDDQDWLEENAIENYLLFSYLEPERKERIAIRMVAHGQEAFAFDRCHESLEAIKEVVPSYLHTALEEAQAAKYMCSDKHHDIVTLGLCVRKRTSKDRRELRAIPLDRLVRVCERGVAVGLEGVMVSRLLRDEIRKRKTPLRDISDESIVFLGAHLPEEEARELIVKTAGVSKKRDLAAFLEDF